MTITRLNPVAEKSTSNSWDVTKFPDGRMIATRNLNVGTITCSRSWGSAWYGASDDNGYRDISLPSGFTEVPSVYCTYDGGGGLTQLRAANVSKTAIGWIYVVEYAQNNTFSYDIRMLAVGRWK